MKKIDSSPSQEKARPGPFQDIWTNASKLNQHLKENDITGVDLKTLRANQQWWIEHRKPAADIIREIVPTKEGPISVLDFGCADGFFLLSLEYWLNRSLEPYGIDKLSRRVKAARKLFPGKELHFAKKIEELEGLPTHLDVVYWNAWHNISFNNPADLEFFRSLLKRAGPDGKLLVGFYHEHKAEEVEKKLAVLRKNGHTPLGKRSAKGDVFVWFQGIA